MALPHLGLILLICTIWGFNFIVGKAAMEELSPMVLTGARFLLLSVLLIPFLKLVRGQMLKITVVALSMGAAHFAFMFAALGISDNVSVVAIGVHMNVPFATLLSVLLLGERVGRWRWAGMALAFAGVVVISFEPAVFSEPAAMGFVVLAALMAAVGIVTMRTMVGVDVFTLQAWVAILSWPPMLVLTLRFEPAEIGALFDASWIGWGAVLYTALGASLVGHAGMYYLLQRYEVSLVSPITLLAPVLGVIFGVTIWGDTLTLRFFAGGLMTLVGVLVIALRRPPPPPASPRTSAVIEG